MTAAAHKLLDQLVEDVKNTLVKKQIDIDGGKGGGDYDAHLFCRSL